MLCVCVAHGGMLIIFVMCISMYAGTRHVRESIYLVPLPGNVALPALSAQLDEFH